MNEILILTNSRFAIVWPQMAVLVFSNGRQMWAGWVSTLVGIGVTTGELIGGMAAEKVGKTKYQCMAAITVGSILLAGNLKPHTYAVVKTKYSIVSAVCTPDTPKTAM
jgi:hypothetical protein